MLTFIGFFVVIVALVLIAIKVFGIGLELIALALVIGACSAYLYDRFLAR